MSKRVYSIVLADHVVEAVDRLAIMQGTSRSNLINHILAEYVCCTTPEMQMQSVFSVMEKQMNQLFRIQTQASDAMMSMHSALRYKYRPALRYRVELMRESNGIAAGWFKVYCRTQSNGLLTALDDFFRFFIQLEINTDPLLGRIDGMYELAPGRMTRCIRRNGGSPEEIGEAISLYIRNFDKIMQSYFSGMLEGVSEQDMRQVSADIFCKYYGQQEIPI